MPTLSAFADEISPDPQEQMDGLEANGIRFIELRGVAGENVMTFSNPRCQELKKQFTDRGFGISCIGSPIGKARLDEDWRQHFDAFKRSVELAECFDAKFIRIFSYYPPKGKDVSGYRGDVVRRLTEQLEYVAEHPQITLVLENESNLFGAYPEHCAYLHAALPSKQLRMAFDPANFVNMNVPDVYNTCWLPLQHYVGYLHIKDFKYGQSDAAVPAGEGDGCLPEILRDAAAAGYDGFVALEPHLGKALHSTGETGPELFNVAVAALKKICADVGWKV